MIVSSLANQKLREHFFYIVYLFVMDVVDPFVAHKLCFFSFYRLSAFDFVHLCPVIRRTRWGWCVFANYSQTHTHNLVPRPCCMVMVTIKIITKRKTTCKCVCLLSNTHTPITRFGFHNQASLIRRRSRMQEKNKNPNKFTILCCIVLIR